MLRRKLFMHLGPLVALLLLTAVAAIVLLQDVFQSISQMDSAAQAHELHAVADRFRWVVIGLALVFLVVINVAVIVLLRTASMVLRPVEKLLVATRQLGNEHFDCRVQLEQHDEFDELAKAYNTLAEALQTNEQRRIETLAQAAVAMNHELNNALAIIDLQLTKLGRQAGVSPALEEGLRRLRDPLQRVTKTVQSLKNVRRIVLTDYTPGTKMLDLQESVREDQPAG